DVYKRQALDTLDMLLKNMPMRPDITAPAAQAYLMKGDLTKARELVEKSLGEFKDNPQLHALMAKIRFSEGKYENAVSEVEYLLKRSLINPELLYFGALSSLRLNQKDKAEAFTTMIKKIAPDSWQALHAQSLIAISKNDRKTAFQLAERAATLYPKKPQALTLYASLSPGVITKEEAIRRITGICSQNDTAFCHLIIARLMEASKNINGALDQMNTAIRMEPENASLYHVLAQFYARNSMIKKAIDEYQSIIHKKPDDMRAALMLALLNQGQGNIADAKKVYTYILEKDPKHALAANNLAWILSLSDKQGDLNEALRLAQLAKDKYPEDPRIADTLGFVLLKKGLNENAIAQFQLALEKMPQEPSINYHMATAMAALKRNAEARKYVENALS
ncbi:MAG: tetratricopeptide repeat protein, partial [Methanotrichaceae archaeon]|nr:tetratricopeptide repeat protein [Methanotrichaceae archaeon]